MLLLRSLAAVYRLPGSRGGGSGDGVSELPARGGKFIQMEDEIASMCAVIGASLTGHKVMTATSGPGFSLKQEAIGYACMAEIPCVIVNVQRGGPSTGNPTHVSQGDVNQARWGTHGDHAFMALPASNHQDAFAITVDAFNLAEGGRPERVYGGGLTSNFLEVLGVLVVLFLVFLTAALGLGGRGRGLGDSRCPGGPLPANRSRGRRGRG